MSGIVGNGFMGRGGGVIPTPQAGVCTPYPITIPSISGILSYVSCFNSCDQFAANDRTGNIVADGNNVSYVDDISGIGNDALTITVTVPSSARAANYRDLGSGDVFWSLRSTGGTFTTWKINPAWQLNNTVGTLMALVRTPTVTNTLTTRFGPHFQSFLGFLRFTATGRLEYAGDGAMSTAIASINTWMVISVRSNNNLTLGVDKSYELVKASAPIYTGGDFTLWSPNGNNGQWAGDVRDIAVFDRAITDVEMDTMVDYMKAKWNL